jgi:hypothetical protein
VVAGGGRTIGLPYRGSAGEVAMTMLVMVSGQRPGSRVFVGVVVGAVALLTFGVGTASAKPVSASKWGKGVCAAWTTFRSNSALATQFSAVTAAAAGDTPDVAVLKSALASFFDAAPPVLQTLSSQFKKAGEPTITNGKKIAQTYVSAVDSLAQLLTSDKAKLPTLPSDPAALKSAVGDMFNASSNAFQGADQKVKTLDKDRKVKKALADCGGSLSGAASSAAPSGGASSGGAPSGAPPTAAPAASPGR